MVEQSVKKALAVSRAESDQTIEELCQASERPTHVYEHVRPAGECDTDTAVFSGVYGG